MKLEILQEKLARAVRAGKLSTRTDMAAVVEASKIVDELLEVRSEVVKTAREEFPNDELLGDRIVELLRMRDVVVTPNGQRQFTSLPKA